MSFLKCRFSGVDLGSLRPCLASRTSHGNSLSLRPCWLSDSSSFEMGACTLLGLIQFMDLWLTTAYRFLGYFIEVILFVNHLTLMESLGLRENLRYQLQGHWDHLALCRLGVSVLELSICRRTTVKLCVFMCLLCSWRSRCHNFFVQHGVTLFITTR